eukprot:gene31154-5807_t
MRSGLADWDTDGARAWQTEHPFSRVARGLGSPAGNGGWVCPPGECGCSTGYVLLGYVLAHLRQDPGAGAWEEMVQVGAGGDEADTSGRQGAIHGYDPSGGDVWRQSMVNGWTSR